MEVNKIACAATTACVAVTAASTVAAMTATAGSVALVVYTILAVSAGALSFISMGAWISTNLDENPEARNASHYIAKVVDKGSSALGGILGGAATTLIVKVINDMGNQSKNPTPIVGIWPANGISDPLKVALLNPK